MNKPYIVRYANFSLLQLIDVDGVFHDKVKISDAKRMAQESGLDLVCFSESSGGKLALCKIIDYGKWKYNDEKSKKKAEKEQHQKKTKEIQFTPMIDDGDIKHKIKQILGIISDGDDVIIAMKMFGRQREHFDLAVQKVDEIIKLCGNIVKEVYRKKNPTLILSRITKNNEVKEVIPTVNTNIG